MKALFFGILVLFTTLSFGGELDDLVKDKSVEYVGTCRLDANGILTFDDTKTKTITQCVVGYTKEHDDSRFVLFYTNGKPSRLVEFSKQRGAQRVLWAYGSI